MAIRTMTDLSLNHLQDIYYAEKQALKTYPKIIKAVESDEVKQILVRHREETKRQVERLEQVFDHMGKRPRAKTCAAMNGLIEETEEAIEDGERGPVLDANLIASAQAMEHYEIARYGAMVAWARARGEEEIADLLQQTLDEEKRADALMTEVAVAHVNHEAADDDEEDEEGDEDDDEEENDEDDEDEDDDEDDDDEEKKIEPADESPKPARGRRMPVKA